MRVIDFHTHAFPDAVAEKAIPALEAEADVKAFHDGTLTSLLSSMDRAGIEKSVICSIATKPSQFEPILEWSRAIASSRIIPFASLHPEDPDLPQRVREVKAAGLKGIKMHPYYQHFSFNEPRLFPLYEAISAAGLVFISHTGFDIAFPHDRIVDPVKISAVVKMFPDLKVVATHLGAWQDWDEVEKHLIGKPVYLDISYTLGVLGDDQITSLLQRHPQDYLLFGSDSPWDDQKRALDHFLSLPLKDTLKEKMLFKNATRLLALSD
jgi:predicted TIM-barrel fold metal-dependent hydrolase